jgi:hypothetical protein
VKFRVPADLTPAGSNPAVEIMIAGEAEAHPLKVRLPKLP